MELISATELPPIPDNLVDQANKLYSELGNSDKILFDQVTSIYNYMDEMEKYVSTFTTCRKGCAHCCKIDVQITVIEAEYKKHGPIAANPSYMIHKSVDNYPLYLQKFWEWMVRKAGCR